MTAARFIIAIVILLFAAYIVVMNWRCAIGSLRNRKLGIDRHYSMVPVASVILVSIADLIYPLTGNLWMISIPLLDIANWNLLRLPFTLIRRPRKNEISEQGGAGSWPPPL